VPLYIQVASVLRTRIQSGQWSAGDKISTLEELEREFEVARVTGRQDVDILREEGLLQARQDGVFDPSGFRGHGYCLVVPTYPNNWSIGAKAGWREQNIPV